MINNLILILKKCFSVWIICIGFVLTAFSAEPVTWINVQNTASTGNNVQHSGSGYYGMAKTSQTLTGAGYFQWTHQGGFVNVGLGNNNDELPSSIYDLDFHCRINTTGGDCMKGNQYVGDFPALQIGDILRIEIEQNGNVSFKRNGTVFASINNPTKVYPYYLVFRSYSDSVYKSIGNAQIQSSISTGSCTPNIRTNNAVYTEPQLPVLPASGGKFCDPTFGTEIMRVTDSSSENGLSFGTTYSYWRTFSYNNAHIFAVNSSGGAVIYDFNAVNYSLGAMRAFPGGYNVESASWSDSEPDIIYAVKYSSASLYKINVVTMQQTLVHSFVGERGIDADDYFWQMSKSGDDDTYAFLLRDGFNYSYKGYVVYRKSSDTTILTYSSSTVNGQGIDEVQLNKTGRYLSVLLNATDSAGFRYYVRDLQTGTVTGLTAGSPDFAPGHNDIGADKTVGSSDDNRLTSRDYTSLHTPLTVLDFGSDYGFANHFSLRGDNDAWGLLSTYDGPGTSLPPFLAYHRELFLIKTDGSQQVRRLAHHRSRTRNTSTGLLIYENTPRANLSKDGKFLAFTSNWENALGTYGANYRTDLFILRIPDGTAN